MKSGVARVLFSCTLFLSAAMIVAFLGPSTARGDAPSFIRGDVNQDGVVSLSDMVFIDRWLFGHYGASGLEPSCLAAADVNDNKAINICDMMAVLYGVFLEPGWSFLPPPPFPEPGSDTDPGTAALAKVPICTEDPGLPVSPLGCASYEIEPAEETDDLVAIGDAIGSPGEEVKIPVYLTSSIPVTAVQLVVEYDPAILEISSDSRVSLSFEGTFYEQFFGKWYTVRDDRGGSSSFRYDRDSVLGYLTPRPDKGLFTVAIAGHILFQGFEVPPGETARIAWIRAKVSPDAVGETVVSLNPTNGPDGQGVGPYRMRNEITYDGNARYVSFIPKTEPGIFRVAIVGDVTFFIRGDSNRDAAINIADPIYLLNYLFRGGDALSCPDAADANDDGALDIADAISLLNFLFLGGAPPPPPFPEPGPDPTFDQVGGCRP